MIAQPFASSSLSLFFSFHPSSSSLDSLPSLCLRMAMIPGTAYAPFYALLFTETMLLSARLAISTVWLCMRERPRAHTSHNGTAAHFKHGK